MGSELSTPPPIPDLNKPPPSLNLGRPPSSSYKMPNFVGIQTPPPGYVSHPLPGPNSSQTTRDLTSLRASSQQTSSMPKCSQPPSCIQCQLNPSCDIVRCPSCPQYTVILDQDLALPTDIPVVGEVKVE